MVLWSTIESGASDPGVPDSNGVISGIEFWVEMKQAVGNLVSVRAAQVAWHTMRRRRGSRTFFAVRRSRRLARMDELFIFDGADAQALSVNGLRGGRELLHCTGGPSAWDWTMVLETLTVKPLAVSREGKG